MARTCEHPLMDECYSAINGFQSVFISIYECRLLSGGCRMSSRAKASAGIYSGTAYDETTVLPP